MPRDNKTVGSPDIARRCYRLAMAARYTPEQLAMLEAQVAHFASDDHLRLEGEILRDLSPEQRLAELAEMCAVTEQFLSQLPPDVLERAATREPLPADSVAVLTALRLLPR